MRLLRLFRLPLIFLVLAGCKSATVKHEIACEGYGFQRGTESFANCMMQMERDRRVAMGQMAGHLQNMRRDNMEAQDRQRALRQQQQPGVTKCVTTDQGYGGDIYTECRQ